MDHIPLLIAGGGLAGLSAACTLGVEGHRVRLIDPAPPPADGESLPQDRRTTAILQTGRDMLSQAGVWERLDEAPTPLETMRVVDLRGGVSAGFDSTEVGELPFGWNVRNGALRRALLSRAAELDGVEIAQGAVRSVLAREGEALVTLDDGGRLRCDLLIGADGKESRVRAAAGIGHRDIRTGQKALSFTVAHQVPHRCVSTEVYEGGGPLVLVPLPDAEDGPRSAVVWMVPGAEARRLDELEDGAFSEEVTRRSGGVLGDLRAVGERAVWPIVTRVANRFAAVRVALMAEAAHAVPPIGAQGLNMSLADVAALRDLAPKGLGTAEMLGAYDRARRPDVLARVAAVTALNAAAIGGGVLTPARALAISAIERAPGLRRGLMRFGLG